MVCKWPRAAKTQLPIKENELKISRTEPDSAALAIVANWYFQEWGYLHPSLTQEKIRADLSEKIQRSEFESVFVAVENDSVLGACELKLNEVKQFPEYLHWIGGIFVDSEHRDKGIGSALISFAIEKCRFLKIEYLYLQTESKNEELYLKLGWHPLTNIESHGINRTIMNYSL